MTTPVNPTKPQPVSRRNSEDDFNRLMDENLFFHDQSVTFHDQHLQIANDLNEPIIAPNSLLRVDSSGTLLEANNSTTAVPSFYDGGYRFARTMNFQTLDQLSNEIETIGGQRRIGNDSGFGYVEIESSAQLMFPKFNINMPVEVFVCMSCTSTNHNFQVRDNSVLEVNSVSNILTLTNRFSLNSYGANQTGIGNSALAGIYFIRFKITPDGSTDNVEAGVGRFPTGSFTTAFNNGYASTFTGHPNYLMSTSLSRVRPSSRADRIINIASRTTTPDRVYHIDVTVGDRRNNNIARG